MLSPCSGRNCRTAHQPAALVSVFGVPSGNTEIRTSDGRCSLSVPTAPGFLSVSVGERTGGDEVVVEEGEGLEGKRRNEENGK